MIKLELVKDLGHGTLESLVSKAAQRFGKGENYDATNTGVVVDSEDNTLYTGKTIIKEYGNVKIAYTQMKSTKNRSKPNYIMYTFIEKENDEMEQIY